MRITIDDRRHTRIERDPKQKVQRPFGPNTARLTLLLRVLATLSNVKQKRNGCLTPASQCGASSLFLLFFLFKPIQSKIGRMGSGPAVKHPPATASIHRSRNGMVIPFVKCCPLNYNTLIFGMFWLIELKSVDSQPWLSSDRFNRCFNRRTIQWMRGIHS